MCRERILLPRVGSQRLPPAARKIRQEAAFVRRELHEVAAEEHVDASEGPRLAVWCVFPRVHPGLGGSDAQVDLGQEPGADHADLVDDEPAPEGHAARGVGGCGAVQRVLAGADAAGAVQGVAADVRGIGGLERADLEVDALQVVQQLLEELADEGQDVGFARAGRAVQQPDQGLAAPQRGLLRVQQIVLHQDPVHDQGQERVLLGVELGSHVVPVQPVSEQLRGDLALGADLWRLDGAVQSREAASGSVVGVSPVLDLGFSWGLTKP